METYEILRDLAIILFSAKLCGMIARKCKAPQVAGQIIAGLIIGPCFLGLVQQSDFIAKMAEIGVILVMFSAGLETDLKDLIKTGPKAFAIACFGVFIPFIFGSLLYFAFYGFEGVGTPPFLSIYEKALGRLSSFVPIIHFFDTICIRKCHDIPEKFS